MKRRKRRISRQEVRFLIVFAILSTVVASSLAYVSLNPPPQEQFFTSWILDPQGLAEHYYPADNPNIRLGEQLNWTLGVYNHMDSLQYVVLRVKLLNSTLASPNDTLGEPSPAPVILEFSRILVSNQTWSVPFDWSISNYTVKGGSFIITRLLVNQIPLTDQFATAISGQNFRFVFELWFYDTTTNDLAFSWYSNGRASDVWTQIWFNVAQA